jgi:phosphoribosylformylglycinamidine cyclo-ligase
MKFTYKEAGVDILLGNKLVDLIKPMAARTHRMGTLGGIGGFGGLFELPLEKFRHPVLVSSTDGVGTKLKLAIDLNQHKTIGIDLVAMCVNDIIVQGAEPLFFLDYFAVGKLNLDKGEQIISGIVEGCHLANVALLGGETAEMPGVYNTEDYDLAGFAVGIVEKEKIITGAGVKPDDILIALPSSGLHSNGYSLVRKILSLKNIKLDTPFDNHTLGTMLLTPTRIYVKVILELLNQLPVKAIAHITGGGLLENIPRVLPPYMQAVINTKSWHLPPLFTYLQKQGNIDDCEMLRTFNCGIGMILCVDPSHETAAISLLQAMNEQPWTIGIIQSAQEEKPKVKLS